ncbi:hypothetical protein CFP71_28210 [Amycolatopsis thailandensis]|uniref:Uncharacterized protein n=1 Tax=Amycolatopsis thailandensis TaxID=589330 RepID=A0A229RUJ9_9PSEU|nr:hypothetical protein [Amycolatopsis thailandensis]OXM50316.1 hypothetical protein CFP71_28210 [Amycolatopsis thailandensis]
MDDRRPTFLPALVLSAAVEDHRDHVVPRQSHRGRAAVAHGLAAELVLAGAVSVRDGRVEVLDGKTVESLAAPCGRAILATLSRNLDVEDMLAAIVGPAYTVAWTAVQRGRGARKGLFGGWVLTDPQFTFLWHRVLTHAHQTGVPEDGRAEALWTILAEAGLHRDQLNMPALQPRGACPDSLTGLLLRGDAPHYRPSSRRRLRR